jgi:hypothetical protein
MTMEKYSYNCEEYRRPPSKYQATTTKTASSTLYKHIDTLLFQSEASFGYVGIIQNGPILQNLKEDHRDNHDNIRDRTSLTSIHDSNKRRLLERSHHTKARQTTTINPTTQMDKRRRETLKIASNQTTNKTHHVAHQEKATPNRTTHSHHKREKIKELNPTPRNTPNRREEP